MPAHILPHHGTAETRSTLEAILDTTISATEDRLKATLLLADDITGKDRPEVNDINYVGRVTIPILMPNGRYDSIIYYETSATPMFELLVRQTLHGTTR